MRVFFPKMGLSFQKRIVLPPYPTRSNEPAKSTVRTGLNLPGMSYAASYSGIGTANTVGTTNAAGTATGYNNNFLKGIGSYKLNLTNGLSLKTDGISATNAMNPTNFRRENILPREELLYGQHFTFGASYNGLNNMLRGGAGGMNGRNPGLSLHAGISFWSLIPQSSQTHPQSSLPDGQHSLR
jgi:hypothetical protein